MSRQFGLSRPAGFDGGKSTAGRAPFSARGVSRELYDICPSIELRDRVARLCAIGFFGSVGLMVCTCMIVVGCLIDWVGVAESIGLSNLIQ